MIRLLEKIPGSSDDGIQFREFRDEDDVPAYAILSHTWSVRDDDEIQFKDVMTGSYSEKLGFQKIRFCMQQALTDGLQYCWVDTCCIDKTNSVELNEAITSMFRWYQRSVRCYVYLSDVDASEPTWDDDFRRSRWFTRGWTLQELLAPRLVQFFSKQGTKIGDKISLENTVSEITRIPVEALRGSRPLSEFDVDERFSWASLRHTRRPEDAAYCLFGIFDVYIYSLYGEGKTRALQRLKNELGRDQGSNNRQDFILPFGLSGAPMITSFTGRCEEIVQIEHALPLGNSRETVILHGLGGVGKTQLAIEYARKHQHKYTSVLWLDGKSESSLQQSFVSAAKRLSQAHPSIVTLDLDDDSITDWNGVVDTVKRWLDNPKNGHWLMIIDNVDDPYIPGVIDGLYDVQTYLPITLHGHVLITTRSSQLLIGKQIRLQEILNEKDCIEILKANSQRQSIENEPNLSELLQRLGGLPLALSTAGLYLSQTAIPVADYLMHYESSWLKLQQSSPQLLEYEGRTLQTTWEMSYRRISGTNSSAAKLLELWSHFASQDLWYDLLRAGRTEEAPEWFLAVTESRISFEYHMRFLCNHGLVEARQQPASYGMHRCVHDWVFTAFATDDTEIKAKLARRCIALILPSEDLDYWTVQPRLVNHAKHHLSHYGANEKAIEDHESLYHLGILHYYQHDLAAAQVAYTRALEVYERLSDQHDAFPLKVFFELGILYDELNQPTMAERMFTQTLESYTTALGSKHVTTLKSAYRLGGTYLDQHKWTEAEAIIRQALDGYTEVLGPEHAQTLRTMTLLGEIYSYQRRLNEAEALELQILASYEKTLGQLHILTLKATQCLGEVYDDQGRAADAERMYLRALNGKEKTLGQNDLSTLISYSALGDFYCRLGRLAEAEAMCTRAVDDLERLSKEAEALDVGSFYHRLGMVYYKQGQIAEAEALLVRANKLTERDHGRYHFFTLSRLRGLVEIYERKHMLAEARTGYIRIRDGWKTLYGASDPVTVNAARKVELISQRLQQDDSST